MPNRNHSSISNQNMRPFDIGVLRAKGDSARGGVEDAAVTVEVSAELRDLDAHDLEVHAHPTHGLPLQSGDVHAVHPPRDFLRHLYKDHRERLERSVDVATGSLVHRDAGRPDRRGGVVWVSLRSGAEQEVETAHVLYAVTLSVSRPTDAP